MPNILSFALGRISREIKNNVLMKLYEVDADPKTGDWISDPMSVGQFVSSLEWNKQENTSSEHFSVFVVDGATHALIINWVNVIPIL